MTLSSTRYRGNKGKGPFAMVLLLGLALLAPIVCSCGAGRGAVAERPLTRTDSLLLAAETDLEEDLPDRALEAVSQIGDTASYGARAHRILAEAYMKRKDYAQSLLHARMSMDMAADSTELDVLRKLSMDICTRTGDYEDALSYARLLPDSLMRIGRICLAMGQPEKALSAYMREMDIMPDGDSREKAHLLEMMSRAESLLHREEKSIAHLDEALSMHIRLGEEDETVSDIYYSLGQAYFRKGRMAEALDCFGNVRRMEASFYGEDDARTGDAWVAMATTYEAMASYERSAECYDKAIGLFSSKFGEDSGEVALCCFLYGRMRFAEKSYDEALRMHSRALAIRLMAENQDEKATESSLFSVGACYLELGNRSEARTYLEKAYGMSRRIYGERHAETLMIASWISRL